MKLLFTTWKALLIGALLVFSLNSCTKEEIIYKTATPGNLVIISDNDPGSFLMVKIVGDVKSAFPDIHITYLQSKLFDVYEGAFLLNTSLASFPEGSVIVGVVEPGADSRRMVMQIGSKRVLAPDNTLATWILHDHPGSACYYVENPAVFHGAQPNSLAFEDFYSQAIISLISNAPGPFFGAMCSNPATFPVQSPVLHGDTILGQVLFTDNFGNCITNITDSLVQDIPMGTLLALSSDTTQLGITMGSTYSSVPIGENVCFLNSSKQLKLAVNYGNFSQKYSLASGARIKLLH